MRGVQTPIRLLRSRAALAAALVCLGLSNAAQARAAPARTGPELRLGLDASTREGLQAQASLMAGEADIGIRVAWPAVGDSAGDGMPRLSLAASFPYMRVGSVRTAGLASMLYRPAQSGPALSGLGGGPLTIDGSSRPALLGLAIGEGYGLFVAAPALSDGSPDAGVVASGAWLSAPSFSAIVASASGPGSAGGPGWYDQPRPPSDRVFAAVGASASGKAPGASWTVAAAAAGCAAFPGDDAAAARLEARAALGRLRLETAASVASASWSGPDGATAPFLTARSEARYAKRGFSGRLGLRFIAPDAPARDSCPVRSPAGPGGYDEALDGAADGDTLRGGDVGSRAATTWYGSGELLGGAGLLYISARVTPSAGLAPSIVELDTRLSPGFAPWLGVASSWRAADLKATRFDVLVSAKIGRPEPVSIDAGVRCLPQGAFVRGAVSLRARLGALEVSGGCKTGDWLRPEAIALGTLAYWIRVSSALQ